MMIEGIKHRILAYLFKAHSLDGPSSDAVRKFFYDFQDYTDLIIWKVRVRQHAASFLGFTRSYCSCALHVIQMLALRDCKALCAAIQAQLLDRRTLLLSTGLRNPTRTRTSNVRLQSCHSLASPASEFHRAETARLFILASNALAEVCARGLLRCRPTSWWLMTGRGVKCSASWTVRARTC